MTVLTMTCCIGVWLIFSRLGATGFSCFGGIGRIIPGPIAFGLDRCGARVRLRLRAGARAREKGEWGSILEGAS